MAGATLLQRVASAITQFGGSVQSSQVDLQGPQSKDGFVTLVISCEMEQPNLQKLLYDLEAGMPFLFIDQLVVQGPQTSTVAGGAAHADIDRGIGSVEGHKMMFRHVLLRAVCGLCVAGAMTLSALAATSPDDSTQIDVNRGTINLDQTSGGSRWRTCADRQSAVGYSARFALQNARPPALYAIAASAGAGRGRGAARRSAESGCPSGGAGASEPHADRDRGRRNRGYRRFSRPGDEQLCPHKNRRRSCRLDSSLDQSARSNARKRPAIRNAPASGASRCRRARASRAAVQRSRVSGNSICACRRPFTGRDISRRRRIAPPSRPNRATPVSAAT